ncbi:ABC transporter substrate-binding protein [Aquihabitans sp. G128]|uniref:ABC transporter substrate-binding protein n=1 Tax=Aquihabitans sp. G128 TaxID=2849779 RepID=UPI001C2152BC|nr:ABC transporter substrate-binding protein [Aquihabitans sp. G128]QXC60208.1 ABC transporter substrate-binding protein [Aquihabitans sp. G128]
MSKTYDRRAFLGRGGLTIAGAGVLAAGGGTLLAACGSSDSDSSSSDGASGSGDFGTLDYQLSWIKNVEFAGEYIAIEKGYYTDAGFSKVNLMSGGAGVKQDDIVQGGKALIGVSSPDITGSAILKGADLIIVGAQYQKNPFCVMSMADTPINTPEDMYGKKIGVQATNESVWAGFIKAAGLDASKITKVPVQFDPLPLTTGTVDGWFSFVTNEPNSLKVQGFDTVTFLLNDHGYPYFSESIMVKKSSLDKDRDKIKAALIGDIKGWTDAIADPALGAKLAATKYGRDLGLDEKEQVLESKAQNALIGTDDTKANGLLTISDELIKETLSSLKAGGIEIKADQLIDTSLLEEIYKENPELKG